MNSAYENATHVNISGQPGMFCWVPNTPENRKLEKQAAEDYRKNQEDMQKLFAKQPEPVPFPTVNFITAP